MLDTSAGGMDYTSTTVEPGELYSASEQLFFLGTPVAHVVAWEEWLRESRRRKFTAASRKPRRPLSVG